MATGAKLLRSFTSFRNALALVALALILGGAGKPKSQIDLEQIAASEPRIEYIARALCWAHGLDPDHDAFPYPGPLWERFIIEARDYLTEHDTLDEWLKRRTGHTGTTTPPN